MFGMFKCLKNRRNKLLNNSLDVIYKYKNTFNLILRVNTVEYFDRTSVNAGIYRKEYNAKDQFGSAFVFICIVKV